MDGWTDGSGSFQLEQGMKWLLGGTSTLSRSILLVIITRNSCLLDQGFLLSNILHPNGCWWYLA